MSTRLLPNVPTGTDRSLASHFDVVNTISPFSALSLSNLQSTQPFHEFVVYL